MLWMLITVGVVGGTSTWESNSYITNGLTDIGDVSKGSVFQMGGSWYLLAGIEDPGRFGFKWSGAIWEVDNDITNGISSEWMDFSPDVFTIDGTTYFILGEEGEGDAEDFKGFRWTGSTWESYPTIINGLYNGRIIAGSDVYQKDNIWYMITIVFPQGEGQPKIWGYHWAGTTWQVDDSIVAGLPTESAVGDLMCPATFRRGGVWYTIFGHYDGDFFGYNWTGSAWQVDNGIVSGLGNIGQQSHPTVFNMWDRDYLISGNAGENPSAFDGFIATALAPPGETYTTREENFNNMFGSLDTWSFVSTIFGSYENSCGKNLFWLIIILIPFTMSWIKQQSVIIPSILALVCGSTLFVLLPVESIAAIKILLIIGISGIVYHILKAR